MNRRMIFLTNQTYYESVFCCHVAFSQNIYHTILSYFLNSKKLPSISFEKKTLYLTLKQNDKHISFNIFIDNIIGHGF